MSRQRPADDGHIHVDGSFLRMWPLPEPDDGGKASRGDVLIIGGTVQTPGSVVLAGLAALRSGAGRLKIATVEPAAAQVAMAVPEGRIIGLQATDSGEIDAGAAEKELSPYLASMGAVLIGPGALDPHETSPLIEALLPAIDGGTVVIDANAAVALADRPGLLSSSNSAAILVPNSVEAAAMLGVDPSVIEEAPGDAAVQAAHRFGAVVAVRTPETWVTAPDAACYRDPSGNPGLGTSGSGDVLSGVVAGLAARGAEPLQAAVWGVHVHGTAGERLARRIGPVGYLARELLDEIPRILADLAAR